VSGPQSWLAERSPPAPEPFQPWLATESRSGDLVDVLCRAARASLADALARPGRNRESAFRLLAADALATYACEAAAESSDLEGRLLDILARLQQGTE
jgi:hypothetical protein